MNGERAGLTDSTKFRCFIQFPNRQSSIKFDIIHDYINNTWPNSDKNVIEHLANFPLSDVTVVAVFLFTVIIMLSANNDEN